MKSKKASLSKTALLLTIILSVAFVLGFTHQSLADVYVDNDGTCSGNTPCYASIQTAIDNAISGVDDVNVYEGTGYAEDITMKDGVNVVSAEPGTYTPTISGATGGGGGKEAVIVFSGDMTCNLNGFEISGTAGAAIFLNGSADPANGITANIENCEIHGNSSGAGIRLNGVVKSTIRNCNIYGNQKAGIVTRVKTAPADFLKAGSSITILGSTIGGASGSNNRFAGIALNGAEGASNIQATIGGSDLADSNNISYNRRRTEQGSEWGGVGIWLNRINTVHIENNVICNNERVGIVLIDVTTGTVENNEIYGHDTEAGINIGGASGLTIGPNNEIYSNYTGIAFYAELNDGLGFDPSVRKASSGTVIIGGTDWNSRNVIHSNTKAGIAVIDPLSGPISIQFNEIYGNGATKAGIAFFNQCTADIQDNEIKGHTASAGIFTGDWSGTLPPDGSGFYTTVPAVPASLTITRNKVHGNRAGMRLDHASGSISNNLVYGNSRGGIRFSGHSEAPYTPFEAAWGITDITNNTVADNGSEDLGGGIVYDDISDTARSFLDSPPQGTPPDSLVVKNNISAYNVKAGIRAGCTESTIYNLLYGNYGYTDCDATVMNICVFRQLGLSGVPCWPLPTGVIFDDPLFVDHENVDLALRDYRLEEGSPAIEGGEGSVEMGAYGGPDPLTIP